MYFAVLLALGRSQNFPIDALLSYCSISVAAPSFDLVITLISLHLFIQVNGFLLDCAYGVEFKVSYCSINISLEDV